MLRDYYGNIILDFTYDVNGQPYAMLYNGTPYFYILNLQGDVIRMVDGNGNIVANYEYDPYGKVISATGSMADINPLRYRGYYYDQETKLYHLWSRYYDPQTGRFINADALASTGQTILGYNMFAYCGNGPISRKDIDGEYWVYVINESETVLVGEEDDGEKRYQTTISYTAVWIPLFGCRIGFEEPTIRYEVPFAFSVTNDGVILYDNKQAASSHLENYTVRNKLAYEMRKTARAQVSDSLEGRSVAGIARELYLHYVSYSLGFFKTNAEESFVGGVRGSGYDRNGFIFEFFTLY